MSRLPVLHCTSFPTNYSLWCLFFSAQDGSQRDMNDCKIFERHEPLRFVVALLNFIREDATPLLSPGDRLNGVDNVSSTPAIKERASGILTSKSLVFHHRDWFSTSQQPSVRQFSRRNNLTRK